VAVHLERVLAPGEVIDHRADAAADEPLDFLRTAPEVAAFAWRTRVRGTRQHRVLGREPPFAPTLLPAGHAILDGNRAEHARVAEAHEAGAFGVGREVALQRDGTQRVGRASARTGISHWT